MVAEYFKKDLTHPDKDLLLNIAFQNEAPYLSAEEIVSIKQRLTDENPNSLLLQGLLVFTAQGYLVDEEIGL